MKRKDIEFTVGDSISHGFPMEKELERIYNVFHVSMLQRYRSGPSHVIPLEQVEVRQDLTYEEEPIRILARDVNELRNKRIPVKILWRNHGVEEATWELDEDM
ncbi:uncharacterized protein LOC120139410 [Hibiscus syriacus]|uniref:uncharacterized protein LOC120139410 n=1 Tax=Hibiscus syriacus TaxID=106335 RepID=UPI00192068AD|nr:uncharacterized protein LOC120139410 [Hibiscus syriacus]